jgi:CMP-N-acetylneuraminic acid synthetase
MTESRPLLAIIPARGGSKRLPGKNIAMFGGRPLIAWSVALAKSLRNVVCVVSTDDAEIARVAQAEGAQVFERPDFLATDQASSVDVMIHVAEEAHTRGINFGGTLLLQPTNPLRPSAMVEQAIARFKSEPCTSLISVSERQLKLGSVVDRCFVPTYDFGTQSRLMAPAVFENGMFYLTHRETLLSRRSLTGDRVLAFPTRRPYDDVDIDEPVDLIVGEAVLAAVRHTLGY